MRKIQVKGCCGKTKTVWELDFPMQSLYLSYFFEFQIHPNYLKAGILHISNSNFEGKITMNSNVLDVICKKSCEDTLKHLEEILENIYDFIRSAQNKKIL